MYFLIGLPFVRLARYAERRFTPGAAARRQPEPAAAPPRP